LRQIGNSDSRKKSLFSQVFRCHSDDSVTPGARYNLLYTYIIIELPIATGSYRARARSAINQNSDFAVQQGDYDEF
jgi:hypothetical protein